MCFSYPVNIEKWLWGMGVVHANRSLIKHLKHKIYIHKTRSLFLQWSVFSTAACHELLRFISMSVLPTGQNTWWQNRHAYNPEQSMPHVTVSFYLMLISGRYSPICYPKIIMLTFSVRHWNLPSQYLPIMSCSSFISWMTLRTALFVIDLWVWSSLSCVIPSTPGHWYKLFGKNACTIFTRMHRDRKSVV